MEDRLAVISCIISDPQSVSVMNEKLHLHASMIIARLGVPCREYGVSVLCSMGPRMRSVPLQETLER